ncbi:sigma-70 family RNA polymerase sigma factor [Bacillus sp. FJAT-52991]|uniref:Sigma-70 family RNA polymerase sigma factor n=1 Tax=Bacillus kandeliae TaxID=3129297 RepID=A0ABZ2N636_9BACI
MENFENVYHQFLPIIHHIMKSLHIYKDQDEFQQIGQVALWEAYEKYDQDKGAFSSIAYSYIKGRMMDALKKSKQREQRVVYTNQLFWEEKPDEQSDKPFELDILLTYAIHLTHREKVWLIRTFYQDMTITEIAQCENVSPSTVKKWRKQAMNKLKLHLAVE